VVGSAEASGVSRGSVLLLLILFAFFGLLLGEAYCVSPDCLQYQNLTLQDRAKLVMQYEKDLTEEEAESIVKDMSVEDFCLLMKSYEKPKKKSGSGGGRGTGAGAGAGGAGGAGGAKQQGPQLPPVPLSLKDTEKITPEEIEKIKEKAWEYRKALESPAFVHKGNSRIVFKSFEPIDIYCAVGYHTMVVLPFEVTDKTLAVGNKDVIDVQVMADKKTLIIIPKKPFFSTNISARAVPKPGSDENIFEQIVAFHVQEVYDKENADYIVVVTRRDQKEFELTEDELFNLAVTGISAVSEFKREARRIVCVEDPVLPFAGLEVVRICALSDPAYLVMLVSGETRCFGTPCDFEAIIDNETMLAMHPGRIKLCRVRGKCYEIDGEALWKLVYRLATVGGSGSDVSGVRGSAPGSGAGGAGKSP